MPTKTSGNFAVQLAAGSLNWDTDDIRILLVDASSTLSDTDLTLSDAATLGEVAGVGYARISLNGRNVDAAVVGDIVRFLANDAIWGTMTPSTVVSRAIVYKHMTNDADSIPLILIDLGSTVVASDTLTILWPGTGVTYLRYGSVA